MILCDSKPHKVKEVECQNSEFMFWLYCPIKVAGSMEMVIPETLMKFKDIIDSALSDFDNIGDFLNSYVYITAKSLVVTPESLGQREGWHLDGFLTNDTNYIWSDVNSTTFSNYKPVVSEDHESSLKELEKLDRVLQQYSYRGKPNTLYRLDSKVVHKPSKPDSAVFRNFVKVSVSDKEYSHSGASINHKLQNFNSGKKRFSVANRNCPI